MSTVSPVPRMMSPSEALEALLVAEAKLRAGEKTFWRGFIWGLWAGGLLGILFLVGVVFLRGG